MTLLGTLGVDLCGPTAFGERDTLLGLIQCHCFRIIYKVIIFLN